MKVFNPIGIGVTIGLHVVAGVLLISFSGCQTPREREDPEVATRPEPIPAGQLGSSERPFVPPTRPAWARDSAPPAPQTETVVVDEMDWNFGVGSEQVTAGDPIEGELRWEATAPDQTATPATTNYTVVSGDNLTRIATRHGTTVRAIEQANNLAPGSVLRIGQVLKIPSSGRPGVTPGAAIGVAEVSPAQGDSRLEPYRYTVVSGDNLSRLANRFETTVQDLMAVNNLSSDRIRVGQELVIPGRLASEGPVAGTRPSTSRTTTTTTTETRTPSRPPLEPGQTITHKIERGEVLETIARRYGTTAAQIRQDNNITDDRRLQIGQELRIRRPASAGDTERATTGPSTTAPSETRTTLRDRTEQRRDAETETRTERDTTERSGDTGTSTEQQRRLRDMLEGRIPDSEIEED